MEPNPYVKVRLGYHPALLLSTEKREVRGFFSGKGEDSLSSFESTDYAI
jgi:hypothetical protein